MREIKFRAWDKIRERMSHAISPYIALDGEIKHVAVDDFKGSCNTLFETEFELMQYTGLKDKNGKEIYEGDIITVLVFDSNQECTVTEVKFVKYNSCSFDVYNPDGTWEIFLEDVQEDCEIIGNIYEHTYLLTTKLNKTLSGDKK
jgi:uncharacterized phage protein (TIGR01671 family)